ncbi:MAG: hypothetical protein AAFR70_03125 [Pseudomonadota bacterium]
MSKPPREPVSLDVYLSELSDEEAGEARAAAERMDALERTIDDVRDLEQRYWWLGVVTGLLFVFGAFVTLYPSPFTEWVLGTFGLMGVSAMTAAFGLLVLAYGFIVRRRSAVDTIKQELNKAHFVPRDAYYFPPEGAGETGRVVFFTPRKLKPIIAGPHDNVRPGASWW